jgi:uncharacterized protein involved in outer membrane biogenesis
MKKRLLASSLLVFLVTVAVLSLTKEAIVQRWFEDAFREHLNLSVKIRGIYVSLLRPRLTLGGFEVANPPQYGNEALAKVGEAILNYDLTAVLQRKLQVKQLSLDILEMNIVKDSAGEINLNTIQEREGLSGKKIRFLDFSVERLNLTIRRVTVQDLNSRKPTQVYNVNLKDLQFRNIETLEGLCRLVALKVLEKIGLSPIGLDSPEGSWNPAKTNPVLKAGSFLSEVIHSLRQALPA